MSQNSTLTGIDCTPTDLAQLQCKFYFTFEDDNYWCTVQSRFRRSILYGILIFMTILTNEWTIIKQWGQQMQSVV